MEPLLLQHFFPNNHVCSIFVNIFPAKHTPTSMKATSFYFIRLVLYVVISSPIYHNFFKRITPLDKKQARKILARICQAKHLTCTPPSSQTNMRTMHKRSEMNVQCKRTAHAITIIIPAMSCEITLLT